MGQEIDLLINYPKTKRNVEDRGKTKSEEDREIARKFDKDFFDGSRDHGYGGFNYNPAIGSQKSNSFINHFNLSPTSIF